MEPHVAHTPCGWLKYSWGSEWSIHGCNMEGKVFYMSYTWRPHEISMAILHGNLMLHCPAGTVALLPMSPNSFRYISQINKLGPTTFVGNRRVLSALKQ